MAGETFEVSLWFNSNKETMRNQLEKSDKNFGVGINIGKNFRYFDPDREYVELRFDNGTSGKAKVMKNRLNHCSHLIRNCIGQWARGNGLWRRKLKRRSVAFRMRVIKDFEVYFVSSK